MDSEPTDASLSRRNLLRGAAGIAGGLFLAGCGTTSARPVEVMATGAPQVPNPTPTSTIAPLPRTIPTQAPEVTLTMRDGSFFPRVLTVTPGTSIKVVNSGGEKHSLVPAEYEDHGLRSSDVGPANTVHMTAPDSPGEYHYSCFWHSWIGGEKGTIRVVADAAEAAAANAQAEEDEKNAALPTSSPTGTPGPSDSMSGFGSTSTPSATPSSTPSATSGSSADGSGTFQ
ncbi:MAG: cupredoxin domain-containing protein [Sporichthyaceae bacterium]